ncbi:MAG: hypothetical protein QW469_03920 [Candidatus Aenigmatarchaeota archaeon]
MEENNSLTMNIGGWRQDAILEILAQLPNEVMDRILDNLNKIYMGSSEYFYGGKGRYSHEEKEISLSWNQHPNYFIELFCHELGHVVDRAYNITADKDENGVIKAVKGESQFFADVFALYLAHPTKAFNILREIKNAKISENIKKEYEKYLNFLIENFPIVEISFSKYEKKQLKEIEEYKKLNENYYGTATEASNHQKDGFVEEEVKNYLGLST